MGNEAMKLVCWKVILGEDRLVVITTAAGNQGQYVKTLVGAGNPYWIWPSIPAGKVIGCDFSEAPICSTNITTNNNDIAAITMLPADVLTYEE